MEVVALLSGEVVGTMVSSFGSRPMAVASRGGFPVWRRTMGCQKGGVGRGGWGPWRAEEASDGHAW